MPLRISHIRESPDRIKSTPTPEGSQIRVKGSRSRQAKLKQLAPLRGEKPCAPPVASRFTLSHRLPSMNPFGVKGGRRAVEGSHLH